MKTKRIKTIAIVAFLTLLVLPNLIMLFGDEFKPNTKHPVQLVKQIKAEYGSKYGSKSKFLSGYLTVKSKVLKDKTLPNRAFKAKQNWWFLGNHYNNSLDNVFGHTSYSDLELKTIEISLNSWQTYLKKINISFYVIVPPNKNKVYKEFLPYQLNQKTTKIQQLTNHLKLKNKINLIDLTEPILNAKNDHQTHIKTDTHWNDYGAYIGYKNTLKDINKSFNYDIEKLTDYTFNYNNNYAGDIPQLIKTHSFSTNTTLRKNHYQSKNVQLEEYRRCYKNTSKTGSVLIHHDSFMLAMMQFMNETFGEVNYLKSYQLSEEVILKHQPNIVILELVERNLDALLKLKKPLN